MLRSCVNNPWSPLLPQYFASVDTEFVYRYDLFIRGVHLIPLPIQSCRFLRRIQKTGRCVTGRAGVKRGKGRALPLQLRSASRVTAASPHQIEPSSIFDPPTHVCGGRARARFRCSRDGIPIARTRSDGRRLRVTRYVVLSAGVTSLACVEPGWWSVRQEGSCSWRRVLHFRRQHDECGDYLLRRFVARSACVASLILRRV